MAERKHARIPLETATEIRWRDQQGEMHAAEGTTRDLSAAGVFVYSEVLPPLGAPVQFSLVLPQLVPDSPAIHLAAEGRVLRVERDLLSRSGFAVINERFSLTRSSNVPEGDRSKQDDLEGGTHERRS